MTNTEHRITRPGSLAVIGGALGALAAAGTWKGLTPGTARAASTRSAACVLTPELTEGPYYIAGESTRRNITEGKPGAPLVLRLGVVEATSCKPIKGAAVEIWHADAGGVYSGFGAGAGNRTFLRGVQRSDVNGFVTFKTLYPGWYQGRTVHIHVKVHVGGNVVHTGQLFFSDTFTDAVYKRAPYSSRPNRDTLNVSDGIFQGGGQSSLLNLRRTGAPNITGSLTMGVRT